jgi:hypothetical protein
MTGGELRTPITHLLVIASPRNEGVAIQLEVLN